MLKNLLRGLTKTAFSYSKKMLPIIHSAEEAHSHLVIGPEVVHVPKCEIVEKIGHFISNCILI